MTPPPFAALIAAFSAFGFELTTLSFHAYQGPGSRSRAKGWRTARVMFVPPIPDGGGWSLCERHAPTSQLAEESLRTALLATLCELANRRASDAHTAAKHVRHAAAELELAELRARDALRAAEFAGGVVALLKFPRRATLPPPMPRPIGCTCDPQGSMHGRVHDAKCAVVSRTRVPAGIAGCAAVGIPKAPLTPRIPGTPGRPGGPPRFA